MGHAMCRTMGPLLACSACVHAATFTVELAATSSTTVTPGGSVGYEITGELTDGQFGMAAFAVDLQTNTGVGQPQATDSDPEMGAFARDVGFANPAGYMGTQADDDLIQVGGAQNTIGNDGVVPNPPYPSGSVVTNVAVGSSVVLATGTVTAPAGPGTYTVNLADPIAAVLTSDTPPVYTVERATCVLGANWSFQITVSDGPVTNQNTGAKYQTIQAAIDEAADGHEIVAAEGTYNENVNFGNKNIILKSTKPDDPAVVAGTIIDGGASGPVVTFGGSETSAAVLTGFTLTNGWDVTAGGGVAGNGTGATISKCVITANWSEYGGGISYCNGYISDCVISDNESSSGSGGGFYGCDGTIRACRIVGNSASTVGGGLHNCAANVKDCIISANTAEQGGGGAYWYNTGVAATLTNCTFVHNSCEYSGGGAVHAFGATVFLKNCILWANQTGDPTGHEIAVHGVDGVVDVSYCDVEGGQSEVQVGQDATLVWGLGNMDDDPQFVDADGPDEDPDTWQDNDYHILPRSPCIDRADSGLVSTTDIDGDFREHDSPFIHTGLTVDMGADEVIDSEPGFDGTLPKTQNNVIFLYFGEPIALPPGNALVIVELADPNVDLSGSFAYALGDPNDPNCSTLRATEAGEQLSNQTWYNVTRSVDFQVDDFSLDVCTLRGDADGSGRVTTTDYLAVKAAIGRRGYNRADLDGSGRVTTGDYLVVKAYLGRRAPAKP